VLFLSADRYVYCPTRSFSGNGLSLHTPMGGASKYSSGDKAAARIPDTKSSTRQWRAFVLTISHTMSATRALDLGQVIENNVTIE